MDKKKAHIEINNFNININILKVYSIIPSAIADYSCLNKDEVWSKLKGYYHTLQRKKQTELAIHLVGIEDHTNLMLTLESYN